MAHSRLPVIVHRWYGRGEGWAYHPDLRPLLKRIVKAVEHRLTLRSTLRFCCFFGDGQLVCDVFPDPSSPNRLAAGRNPSILRVVFGKRTFSDCEVEEIYDLLDELDLPDVAGPDEQLEIQLCDEPMILLDAADMTSCCAHNGYLDAGGIREIRCSAWGVFAALACVLASTVYSIYSFQSHWDLARWTIDLTTMCSLAWTFYFMRRADSAEEELRRGENMRDAE